MIAVVGDLAHADVLNILVFAFFNDHQELAVWADESLRNVCFLVVFHQFLEAGTHSDGLSRSLAATLSHLNCCVPHSMHS